MRKGLRVIALLSILSLASCGNSSTISNEGIVTNDIKLTFTEEEYTLQSGQKVSIKEEYKNVNYQIVNSKYENVSINESTGVISFDNTIPNYSQILVVAKYNNYVSNPVVVTLSYNYESTELTFLNKSLYITNGEYITASSDKNYSLTYSLKDHVDGVFIEEATGKVTYSPMAINNSKFTVVANAHNMSTIEKEFTVMTEGFIKVESSRQVIEKGKNYSAKYTLDFTDNLVAEDDGVISLVTSNNETISQEYYSYDKNTKLLKIYGTISNVLNVGENTLKIITSRNAVKIQLDVASKFIYDVDDLVSINDSEESLSGFYILMNDLDLSNYLSEGGKGYDNGSGWKPIGTYQEVMDTNEATRFAFKGTFDGNGHVITGLYASRTDTYSFNAGLFGYTTSSSVIRNLGVEGYLDVSSYSGGLVGSNSGIIENCYSNVEMNVYTGENIYRFVGGFAGNNFGTIKNCYSIGEVICDTEFGCFVGSNEGIIENCYTIKNDNTSSFKGYGLNEENCRVFNTIEEMQSYNFNEVFSNVDWSFEGSLPTLKIIFKENDIGMINLVLNDHYYIGDRIYLETEVYPSFLDSEDLYFEYEIEGEGYTLINNNYIKTTDAVDSKVKIKVTLVNNGITYTDEKIVEVFKKVESLDFETSLTSLNAGKSYLLSASCSPSDTNEKISYRLKTDYQGVQINGDVLTIHEECIVSSITFYAVSEYGVISNEITLPINQQNLVDDKNFVLFEGEQSDLTFTINNENLEGVKVTLFGKNVEHQIEGNTITISRNILQTTKDTKARFVFELSNGKIYASDAFYLSHTFYNKDNIEVEEIIEISSIEDMYNYFNINPNGTYDVAKEANYNKTYILMNDIDFGNKTIYGIGHGDLPFSGTFYGNGHTISNFVIAQNEKAFKNDQASINSSKYGVGLFAVLSGSIYDLTIEDGRVTSNNYVGGLVGMLTTGSVENCYGINMYVRASDEQYSVIADPDNTIRVGEIIGINHSGRVLCVYSDNKTFNTVG